jgi:hypothetical protein
MFLFWAQKTTLIGGFLVLGVGLTNWGFSTMEVRLLLLKFKCQLIYRTKTWL